MKILKRLKVPIDLCQYQIFVSKKGVTMAKVIQFDPKKRAEEKAQKKESELRKKSIARLIKQADKLK